MAADAEGVPANPKRQVSLRRQVICALVVAAVPFIGMQAFDLIATAGYVFPEIDGFGLFALGGLWLLGTLLLVLILFIVRFFQRRFIEALAVVVGCWVAIASVSYVSLDRPYWKFLRHQVDYRSAVQSDPAAPPRFRIFDWGNRGAFGSAVTFEALVYDESDEIVRPTGSRSKDWKGHGFDFPLHLRWILSESAECTRRATAFGNHFYYFAKKC